MEKTLSTNCVERARLEAAQTDVLSFYLQQSGQDLDAIERDLGNILTSIWRIRGKSKKIVDVRQR